MQFKKSLKDGKWFKYGESDVSFKLRSIPLSLVSILTKDNDSIKQTKKSLEYCIVDWKGLNDEDGNETKFSEDNRDFLIEHQYDEIGPFVLDNLKSGKNLPGPTKKKTSKK